MSFLKIAALVVASFLALPSLVQAQVVIPPISIGRRSRTIMRPWPTAAWV